MVADALSLQLGHLHMKHGVVAVFALGWAVATAQPLESEIQQEAELTALRSLIAAPVFDDSDPASARDAAYPAARRRLFDLSLAARVKQPGTTPFDLIYPFASPFPLSTVGRSEGEVYNPWPGLSRGPEELDDTEVAKLAQQIESMSLREKRNVTVSNSVESAPLINIESKEADVSLVLAGPANQHRAVSYVEHANETRIRIPLWSFAPTLYLWAQANGRPMRLSARRLPRLSEAVKQASMAIEAHTRLPAWIVQPSGLMAATITGFSTGPGEPADGSCQGTGWLELVVTGRRKPPVWAVLVSTRPDWGSGVSVQRLPHTEALDYLEAERQLLEVRWADGRTQALRLIARRFEFDLYTALREDPERSRPIIRESVRSAWGLQVFATGSPRAEHGPQPEAQLLSAGGTPACPPP